MPVKLLVKNNSKEVEVNKIVGIKNHGSNCFMNAVLQVLLSIPDMMKYLSSLEPSGSISVELKRIFDHLRSNKIPEMKQMVISFGWNPYQHQCAVEFFEILHQKLDLEDVEWYNKTMDWYGVMFATHEARAIMIPTENGSTLKQSLQINKQEVLAVGKHLIICLMRTDSAGKKLHKKFDIPVCLDVGEIFHGQSELRELKGMVLHRGSASSGHYKALIKIKKQWIEADDDFVASYSDANIANLEMGFEVDGFSPNILLYSSL